MKQQSEFCAWFSGFAAGEGSFGIRHRQNRAGGEWQVRFDLVLRRDDRAILERLAAQHGGRLYNEDTKPSGGVKRPSPSVRWVIYRLAECRRLVEHFRRYPLYAKKQRDFELWAMAVEHLSLGGKHRNNEYMEGLRLALVAGRVYDAEEQASPSMSQLRLLA